MIDHVREVPGRESGGGTRSQITLGDRDDLDVVPGRGGEVGGHLLLPREALRLLLRCPEADILRRDAGGAKRTYRHKRCELQQSHQFVPSLEV